jgi:hypothetical protein
MPKTDLTFTGGEYAPVADRVRRFYQQYPTGRIVTHLVRRTEAEVVFRAEVFRTYGDREPAATGWAAEREGDGEINTVACLENTETSAVGRALASTPFQTLPATAGSTKVGGKSAGTVHRTQENAAGAGRTIAKQQQSEHSIHGRNGQVREKNSYGNDPNPPKDKR